MSQPKILNGGLFAAALCAAGLLTTPAPAQADPMIPLAPCPYVGECMCNDYRFHGLYSVFMSNGWRVWVNTDSWRRITGPAWAIHGDVADDHLHLNGTAEGKLFGREIKFTTHWNNGSIGVYEGQVDDRGYASGTNFDQTRPEATATWRSEAQLLCMPPGTEPPPPPSDVPPDRPVQGF